MLSVIITFGEGSLTQEINMVKQDQVLLQTEQLNIYTVYDVYASMLLGYIFGVVKDKKIAEDCLVKTFNAIAAKFDEIPWAENNNWRHLQSFAKNELAALNKSTVVGQPSSAPNLTGYLPSKYTERMTEEQKIVFCSIYYSKKTVVQLAKETNKTEQHIKSILKGAFNIIRKLHEN